ncbi:unnamed protein product [Calicophoron daubneyi]|uniref:Uncharacterized protein n=1 Tax=Calicophoron daubneyi TaxID=300641 RepID=A0AAV2T188_CALDB
MGRNSFTVDENRNGFQRFVDKLRLRSHPLLRACLGEFCGTLVLMVFGCGLMAQVILGNHAFGGFLSVSLGWGMAVTFGVFFAGSCAAGHVNPAVTVGFACAGKFPFRHVPFYILSQLAGGFIGSLVVFGVYREKIYQYIEAKDAGHFLVETTGAIFVTRPSASQFTCFLDQVLGTALLAAGVLVMIDPKAWQMPKHLVPLYVGLLIYAIVGCFAINCGGALNPARDLCPRLVILICGWGFNAFSADNYFFWVPIVGPIVGAILGSVLYELTIGIHLDPINTPVDQRQEKPDTNMELEQRLLC